jgi:hypothetical protein
MTAALIIQILEAAATLVSQIAPLVGQGEAVLSQSDAEAVHAALAKAEAATAALRPKVDAALAAAAGT